MDRSANKLLFSCVSTTGVLLLFFLYLIYITVDLYIVHSKYIGVSENKAELN